MLMNNISYDIREEHTEDGGLCLTLVVEERAIASASASGDALHDMHVSLGKERHDVRDELEDVLKRLLKNELGKVSIDELTEDPDRPLMFRATYTYRDGDHVSRGLVWYNVETSQTGPEDLSAVIRNRMRHNVHKHLTSPNSDARALVDLHK